MSAKKASVVWRGLCLLRKGRDLRMRSALVHCYVLSVQMLNPSFFIQFLPKFIWFFIVHQFLYERIYILNDIN